MIQRFFDNFDGGPISEKKAVTFLSHPQWQNDDEIVMDQVLKTTNKYLYKADRGPVLYVTLKRIYKLWK